jgi:hypothetical protein
MEPDTATSHDNLPDNKKPLCPLQPDSWCEPDMPKDLLCLKAVK